MIYIPHVVVCHVVHCVVQEVCTNRRCYCYERVLKIDMKRNSVMSLAYLQTHQEVN